MKVKAPRSEGRFAYEGLDRVIHEARAPQCVDLSDHASERIDVRRAQTTLRSNGRQLEPASARFREGENGRNREEI
jgi:hypothetical protein